MDEATKDHIARCSEILWAGPGDSRNRKVCSEAGCRQRAGELST
jgi:hypothetical protein